MSELQIGAMEASDWNAVRAVLEEGIASRLATFETSAPGWEAWDSSHLPECRFVARREGSMIGWAALSPISQRCIYSGVAEVSIYITGNARRQGIGKTLLQELIAGSEKAGIWTLQAGLFPENRASVALHRSCGFREVGLRERLGKLDGEWKDVLLMERRSTRVGS